MGQASRARGRANAAPRRRGRGLSAPSWWATASCTAVRERKLSR